MGTAAAVPPACREWRRLQALHLKQQGWNQRDIAAALAVSEAAVSRWLAAARGGDAAALRARRRSGAPSRLTPAQRALIPELLWHGAEAYGFRGEVWTGARGAAVIAQEYGVSYSKSHVSRVLRQLGWTPQLPISSAMRWPSPAGGSTPGPSCGHRPHRNGALWYSWTRQASTCCQGWSRPMLPRARHR